METERPLEIEDQSSEHKLSYEKKWRIEDTSLLDFDGKQCKELTEPYVFLDGIEHVWVSVALTIPLVEFEMKTTKTVQHKILIPKTSLVSPASLEK